MNPAVLIVALVCCGITLVVISPFIAVLVVAVGSAILEAIR